MCRFVVYLGVKEKFYVVFVLVNNYAADVVVSTGLPGALSKITIKSGEHFVVSAQPSDNNPILVTAADSITSQEVTINGQNSVSITPDEIFGASFQVLFLHREEPGMSVIFYIGLYSVLQRSGRIIFTCKSR